MPFGLGSKHADPKTTKKNATDSKSAQANEAAEMLKKMEAKKDAGDCPFCQRAGPHEGRVSPLIERDGRMNRPFRLLPSGCEEVGTVFAGDE